jgi:phosphoheptose isomerase
MNNPSDIIKNAIEAAARTITSVAGLQSQIAAATDLISGCLKEGHQVLACGNGGSAADAADFCAEFACRFVHDRRPYPGMNLAQGGSLLTAVGNDYGFEEVFARQVRAFGKPGDVLVGISTSGKSANIRRALEEARNRKLKSIALLGRDGGTTAGLADIDLIIKSESTARIQEAHKFLLHLICEIVDARLPK